MRATFRARVPAASTSISHAVEHASLWRQVHGRSCIMQLLTSSSHRYTPGGAAERSAGYLRVRADSGLWARVESNRFMARALENLKPPVSVLAAVPEGPDSWQIVENQRQLWHARAHTHTHTSMLRNNNGHYWRLNNAGPRSGLRSGVRFVLYAHAVALHNAHLG
ncbi:hypothetical protein EVAR_54509_1 [Eumeta japonica]|uniref:Uncharacterized protein n=1 Tax=Eumeta variegata TaxID=151549 RepID=A0A4C1YGX5_EUMVA|nr:hypothetical protein EVAR_54509_1 [Eumeta japonica]